jgi:hypothetical protein
MIHARFGDTFPKLLQLGQAVGKLPESRLKLRAAGVINWQLPESSPQLLDRFSPAVLLVEEVTEPPPPFAFARPCGIAEIRRNRDAGTGELRRVVSKMLGWLLINPQFLVRAGMVARKMAALNELEVYEFRKLLPEPRIKSPARSRPDTPCWRRHGTFDRFGRPLFPVRLWGRSCHWRFVSSYAAALS